MNGRQQQIAYRTAVIAERLSISEDQAFLRLVHSAVTDQSVSAFALDDLVDGNGDKGLDVVTILRDETEGTLYLIQTKNTSGFSANELLKMKNGLSWMFQRTQQEVASLQNVRLRDKVDEYRSLVDDLYASAIRVVAVYATCGLSSEKPQEFKEEEEAIRNEYDHYGFKSFKLLVLGAYELIDIMYANERKQKRITAEVRIKYDANVPSIIRYSADGIDGLVCTASAREIARIVNTDQSGDVFDSNVRQFLGLKTAVNDGILDTCSSSTESALFWFLNNGITIVCDDFSVNQSADNPKLQITNMQIVNGCQTASTLALAESKGKLNSQTKVLLRIYKAPSDVLSMRIVETTNNQNKITSRNLKSNESHQLDMREGFRQYGYWYEHKAGQYDKQSEIMIDKIASNEIVAQSYLAIVLKEPSIARSRKSVIWGDRYSDIFHGGAAEPYIAAWLIYRITAKWLRSTPYYASDETFRRKIARYGGFFVARTVAYNWLGSEVQQVQPNRLETRIRQLEENHQVLISLLDPAFNWLSNMIKNTPGLSSDLDRALKSSELDQVITRELHRTTR